MQALKDMAPAIRAEYEEGQANELIVREWLEELGYETRDVSKEDDYKRDIDCLARRKGTEKWVRVSIKCNLPRYIDRAFVFELETYSKVHDNWRASWYNTGKADVYVVWKRDGKGGGELYCLKKADVQKYVELNGWDVHTGLTDPATVARAQQHTQTQVKLGLIQKWNATETGIAKLLAKR